MSEASFVDQEKARQAVQTIIAARKGVTLDDGVTLKALISEGRP